MRNGKLMRSFNLLKPYLEDLLEKMIYLNSITRSVKTAFEIANDISFSNGNSHG